MPREKWLIDPAELDDFQRDIRGLGINDSYIVKGCAGSGKTILALYRANDIRIEAIAEDEDAVASFTMIVYTKALMGFIRSGIRELGIPIRQVLTYHRWDASEIDYVIVDEAQDFTQEEIDTLNNAKIKSIMLYGDTQQQIYNKFLKNADVLSVEQIAAHLKIEVKELKLNYRLPKSIASFASHISTDKNIESKCVKLGGDKPRLKKFDSWRKELDFIMEEIKTRNYTDVAILLPFNMVTNAKKRNFHRNVESVKAYFDSVGFRHEFKMRDTESDSFDLDFDSDNPKVMTFHSSKGLQFETVFIPFCDYPFHDQWFIQNYKNPLYVALTRTYRNLYLTHTDSVTPFLSTISNTKYES